MKIILDGMGSKFSRIISSIVCFVAGYTVGFILCWDLTLILLATFPFMMFCGIIMTKVIFYVNNCMRNELCTIYLRNRKRVACVYGVMMHAGNIRRIQEKRVRGVAECFTRFSSILLTFPKCIITP